MNYTKIGGSGIPHGAVACCCILLLIWFISSSYYYYVFINIDDVYADGIRIYIAHAKSNQKWFGTAPYGDTKLWANYCNAVSPIYLNLVGVFGFGFWHSVYQRWLFYIGYWLWLFYIGCWLGVRHLVLLHSTLIGSIRRFCWVVFVCVCVCF